MDPYQDFAQQNEDRNQLGWQLENPMYDHQRRKGAPHFLDLIHFGFIKILQRVFKMKQRNKDQLGRDYRTHCMANRLSKFR